MGRCRGLADYFAEADGIGSALDFIKMGQYRRMSECNDIRGIVFHH